MKIKKICFDLDGVICKTSGNKYYNSKPMIKNIKKINELYDKGYEIIIFTARYMGRSNENQKIAIKKGYNNTYNKLKKWKLKFHKLKLGKPSYDLIVDDKCLFYKKDWVSKINKFL
jgi:histidinol phosphatase-like enzyme